MGGCHSDLFIQNLMHSEASARIDLIREYWAGLADLHPLCMAAIAQCDGETKGAPLLLVFEGTVCDCGLWQYMHPGGNATITMKGGEDATNSFLLAHDTKTARDKVASLSVGQVYEHPSATVDPRFNTCAQSVLQVNRWNDGGPLQDPSVEPAFPAADGNVHGGQALESKPNATAAPTVDAVIHSTAAVGPRTKRIVLKSSAPSAKASWPTLQPGGHVSIDVPGTSPAVSRPYSPVAVSGDGTEMTFFVKAYDKGIASGYLHALKEGAPVRVRGPLVPGVSAADIAAKLGAGSSVLLIAGGTGAAPILTMARWCAEQPAAAIANVHVVACFRDREDAMLVDELKALHDGGRVRVTLVYSRDQAAATQPRAPDAPRVFGQRLDVGVLRTIIGEANNKGLRAVMCGPPPMSSGLPAVVAEAASIAKEHVYAL